jgi:hypothetical protein
MGSAVVDEVKVPPVIQDRRGQKAKSKARSKTAAKTKSKAADEGVRPYTTEGEAWV